MKIEGKEGDWELYTGPAIDASIDDFLILKRTSKSEDDLRKEFAEKWSMGSNPFISEIEIAQKRANLLFDTFELKKK